MTELEKTKYQVVNSLKNLCIRCKEGILHDCPIQKVTSEIEALHGIPVKVNDQLYDVVFN